MEQPISLSLHWIQFMQLKTLDATFHQQQVRLHWPLVVRRKSTLRTTWITSFLTVSCHDVPACCCLWGSFAAESRPRWRWSPWPRRSPAAARPDIRRSTRDTGWPFCCCWRPPGFCLEAKNETKTHTPSAVNGWLSAKLGLSDTGTNIALRISPGNPETTYISLHVLVASVIILMGFKVCKIKIQTDVLTHFRSNKQPNLMYFM